MFWFREKQEFAQPLRPFPREGERLGSCLLYTSKAAAFQLGPGVRVRLSIKEYLQAVVLPVHRHTAPVELPAGKLPLPLFGELFDTRL